MKDLRSYIQESLVDEALDVNKLKHVPDSKIPDVLYHATFKHKAKSIKKLGLGGKVPKKRYWDYGSTPFAFITQGCFFSDDEYVAASYMECSDEYEEYCDRYDNDPEIVVYGVKKSGIDTSKVYYDTNNLNSEKEDFTCFYDGVIPFEKLFKVEGDFN